LFIIHVIGRRLKTRALRNPSRPSVRAEWEVYRARDPRLGRDVALKILPVAFVSDSERLLRFEQEGRAAAALNNPNIVVIYDAGSDGGVFYVATELLEGETLRERLTSPALPVRKAVDYSIQISDDGCATPDSSRLRRARLKLPGHPSQLAPHGLHGLRTILGILAKTALDQSRERFRQGRIQLVGRGRIVMDDGVERGRQVGTAKRPLPAGDLIKDHAEGKNVGAVVRRFSLGLLGRHVRRRAEYRPRLRIYRADAGLFR
jgi:hypothetical protein